jgi:hypothetical protein
MEVNTNPTKILDHCVIVKFMQRDLIVDPNEPQNFLIESTSVAKILDTYRRLFPKSKSAIKHITRDIGDSINIRKKGGTGQGLALFVCGSSMGRQGAPCDVEVLRRYCPISFNSDKGVTCDSLSEILVSDTSQKGDDRVHPAARPTPKWTLNFHIWHRRAPALSDKGYVTRDKCDISDNLKEVVTRDVQIE